MDVTTIEVKLHSKARDFLFEQFVTLRRIFSDVLGQLETDYISIALINPSGHIFFLSSKPSIEQNLIEKELWQFDGSYQSSFVFQDEAKLWSELPHCRYPEWAVHDFEGFGDIRIEEYSSINTIIEYASFITQHGELGKALLAEYALDDAETMLNDCYQGCFNSEVDFAWQLFDECYAHQMPDNLICYFDCEAFARDLFIGDYCSVDVDGQTQVFSRI